MSLRPAFPRFLLSALLVVPSALVAQAAPAVRDLPVASAKAIEEPYSLVAGVREIAGGRVVVVDGGDGEVTVADFGSGERELVGRQGSGPGEYRAPSGIFKIRGDTLWVMDPIQQRFTVFLPDLENGVPFQFQMFDNTTRSMLTAPFHTDAAGRFYASSMAIVGGGGQMRFPDSVDVVRLDPRATPAPRTPLSKVRFPMSGSPSMRVEGQVIHYSMEFPGLVTADSWAVFPDGRVAIVHGATYTVEMIQPDGRRTTSRPIPYERIPVTTADQTTEMDIARKAAADQLQAARRSMPANMTLDFQMTPPASWPSAYPAISPMQIFAAPDGRLWVMRATPAKLDRQHWDVIDASGSLVAKWRLPVRTRLVGVGTGAAYVVKLDEDDLQQLLRVDLPR
jgi:hypothetical protein